MTYNCEITDKNSPLYIIGFCAISLIPLFEYFVTGSIDIMRDTPGRSPLKMIHIYAVSLFAIVFYSVRNFQFFLGYCFSTNLIEIRGDLMIINFRKIMIEEIYIVSNNRFF